MRMIVISDTHRNAHILETIISKHLEDADLFIHLGDGRAELEDMQILYPQKKFLAVTGNCDWGFEGKTFDLFQAGDIQIMLTHGHLYGVKEGLDRLMDAAKRNGSRIVLYGHTHQKLTVYRNGLYIMNPGSASQPRSGGRTYGILDIQGRDVHMTIVDL